MQNKSNSVLDLNSNKLLFTVAAACFFVTLCLILLSQGTYDPGDGVQHFLIAKYALHHPHLFLDHWGKPIYTLLCMPFAQLGFIGSNIYNLICNTATALIVCQMAGNLNFKNKVVGFILVFFSPLFYMTNFSGLTEPTFALLLSASILLFVKSQFAFGTLLLSFLPFARTEGFFIIPVFIIYLAYIKQWRYIFFTAFGTLVYATIGYFVLGDFMWIFNQNPYKGAFEIYGKGPLFHFVAANDRLFGLPLVALFLTGVLALFIKGKKDEHFSLALLILVMGSLAIYFTMHSIFWWKGLFGSLGLHRVMAAVAPLFSLIAWVGFNTINERLSIQKQHKKLIPIAVAAIVIIWPLKQYHPPIKPDAETGTLIQAANWIKDNNVETNQKVFCMYPMMSMLLNIDPFNTSTYVSTCMLQYPDFSASLNPGDLIIWDAHFGAECKFNDKEIERIPKVKKIAEFNDLLHNNRNFKVAVFKVD